jgi:hypothetical protein
MRIKCSLCAAPAVAIAECLDGDRPVCIRCSDDLGVPERKLPTVGTAMAAILAAVLLNPGRSKAYYAQCAGSGHSLAYGYDVVNRCIRASLVRAEGSLHAYRLYLTPLGERVTPWKLPGH